MNIPTVDVQHGLISKTQPGYISKNSIKEDIPMYIFVYGKYFKDIILENSNWFSSNNIIVTGNYYLSKYKINEDVYNHKNNVLLITTQPIVDCKAYEKIIQEALKENLEVYIKIHPSERIEKYEMLRNKYNLKIIDKTENLYEVLKKAKYHATVFSTSAIESLFFGIPNIIIPWKNYENNLDFLVDNKTSIKYNEKLSKILKTLDKNRDKTILKGEYFFHDWDQEKADYILNQYFTTGR
jgi:UDP-N-acetylglucosamine:LPS N-acetylglucosamine transferase